MMDTYFVLWSDYDGSFCEAFSEQRDAEIRVAQILALSDTKVNGTTMLQVIEGEALDWNVIETTRTVRLSRP